MEHFMKWTYNEDGSEALIEISAREYIKNQPVKFEGRIRDAIDEIRDLVDLATLEIDMTGVNILHLDLRSLIHNIRDMYEYTKNRGFLKEIRIRPTNFIFRSVYRPTSLILPRSVRELIKLC
jgi:hypothetical protein